MYIHETLDFVDYLLRLRDAPGEAIQQEATFALGFLQVVLDHADYQVVADQFTIIHYLLDLLPKGRARADFGPQHIARGQVTYAVSIFKQRCLKQNTRN